MTNNDKKETLKSMILYWIEVRHVWGEIFELINDTDEIGELYEEAGWWADDQTGEGVSMMDVHVLLEKAGDKCTDLDQITSKGLKPLLMQCLVDLPEIFGGYAADLKEQHIEKLVEELDEEVPIEDLYEYCTEDQYEKFCQVVKECCEEILR